MHPNQLLAEKYEYLLLEKKLDDKSRKELLGKFVQYAFKKLGINKTPSVVLNHNDTYASNARSFGQFIPSENKIVVVAANRNLADILRTLGHELVHCKQMEDGRITTGNVRMAGKDGSELENEANARAAVLMREFGRDNPNIFE